MTQRIVAGLVVALGVGVGAGLLVGPLARGLGPVTEPSLPAPLPVGAQLEVVYVKGRVFAQTPRGPREQIDTGSVVHRPAVVGVESLRGKAVLGGPGFKLFAEHGARVSLSGLPASNALVLEDGFVLISARAPVVVHVPRHDVKVSGTTFSVWMNDDRMRTAVIEDSVELQLGGKPPKKYARRREIIVSGGTSSSSLLPSRVELFIEEVDRRSNGGFVVRGRTSPRAIVLYRGEKGVQRVRVRNNGGFTAYISAPNPRSLAAYDGSGRWAILDVPSPTVEDYMEVVFGNGARVARP